MQVRCTSKEGSPACQVCMTNLNLSVMQLIHLTLSLLDYLSLNSWFPPKDVDTVADTIVIGGDHSEAMCVASGGNTGTITPLTMITIGIKPPSLPLLFWVQQACLE